MVGRRNQRKGKEEVELNLAAMLDMAFQLLTFFILTFKPTPVEGDIALRLPPPQPLGTLRSPSRPGVDPTSNDLPPEFRTLVVSICPDRSGRVKSMVIGESPVSLAQLDGSLRKILSDSGSPFEQVIIQAGSGLRYDALMSVIDAAAVRIYRTAAS